MAMGLGGYNQDYARMEYERAQQEAIMNAMRNRGMSAYDLLSGNVRQVSVAPKEAKPDVKLLLIGD